MKSPLAKISLIFASAYWIVFPAVVQAGEVTTNINSAANPSANSSANPSATANPTAVSSPNLQNGSESNSNTLNVLEGGRNYNSQAPFSNQINTANSQALPSASINNTSINNNTIGNYRVGDATCTTPTLSVNAYGGMNNGNLLSSSHNYGASLSLQIPLGGSVASSCNKLAKETAKHMELSNVISLVGVCINWARSGVTLTDKAPNELKDACSFVNVSSVPQNSQNN